MSGGVYHLVTDFNSILCVISAITCSARGSRFSRIDVIALHWAPELRGIMTRWMDVILLGLLVRGDGGLASVATAWNGIVASAVGRSRSAGPGR
jgi:hypothetical protein